MSIQAEPQAIDEDATVEIADDATLDNGQESELAPDASAETEEKVTFDDRQQARFDEFAGEQTKARRTAERRTAEVEAQLAEAMTKIPEPTRPTVPELPDPFDDNYAAVMAERDRKMVEAAAHDAEQRVTQHQREQAERQRQFDVQQKTNATAQAYVQRATAAGIPQQELATAIQNIAQAGGVGNEVVSNHILDEDDGALTMHLGANPLVVDQLRSMSPAKAVLFIENKIKPSLSGKKRASTVPSPAKTIPSGGAPSGWVDAKGITLE